MFLGQGVPRTVCSQDRGFSGDKTGRMVWLALLLFSGIAVAKTDVEDEELRREKGGRMKEKGHLKMEDR